MTEVEPGPESASNPSPQDPQDPQAPSPQDPQAVPFDPQTILASLSAAGLSMQDLPGLSITDMEADVEALMNDKMGKLDEMLDGLDQLVARIEDEMNRFEGQPDPPQ